MIGRMQYVESPIVRDSYLHIVRDTYLHVEYVYTESLGKCSMSYEESPVVRDSYLHIVRDSYVYVRA